MNRARVLLRTAAVGPLDYRVPQGMAVEHGSVVEVPLGPRRLVGVVWEEEKFAVEEVGDNRLRNILSVLDTPPIRPELRRLAEWTAGYYLAPLAAVLRMILPSSSALGPGGTVIEYRSTGVEPPRMTAQRERALAKLDGEQGLVRELAASAGVSDAVIRGLVKAGSFEAVEVSSDAPFPALDPDFAQVDLTPEQAIAAESLRASVSARSFAPILLDGVTGSGKTEVYFEAVAQALRQGRQTLVLLPEIALTQAFLKRFAARFGTEPALWHSSLRSTERRRTWRGAASGAAKVVAGARSALFLPFADLACIIVDEAHETSFKQEDGVRYHARDVAVMRGLYESLPVVLASATPALESRHMAEIGRYEQLVIPSRYGKARLPDIKALDLLQDPPERGHWIAPTLIRAIEERLERGEQSLLFLNRRGYAPLTLCRHCGHRIQCPNCTSWMVEHRLMRRLACHHCGHLEKLPEKCPECGEPDSLVACGPGVERICEEVQKLFPDARTVVATSDTISNPAHAAEFVARVEAGAIDIIVGTQLVTKGYHFPNLTLVGVIDADLGLEGGDLRAAERTFQQIAQVAGRAGRAEKPGEVIVQTRSPGHAVIEALVAGERDAFYAAETEARRHAGAPPFGRLAAIIVSSEDQSEAAETARRIKASAPEMEDAVVYGPAPAPLAMLRGRHRQRLLVHARRSAPLQDTMREWLGSLDWPRGVRVTVDVDPYSFL
ncbi:primosomal protein N' [Novosphingopyxis sp.]|uniref:primosomal protein N' n=1 Tax=Novosphingopyxis sp. TaxID=2709690 RepID=UPI003B5B56E2